ncbi:MAG: hypothetical protein ACI95C_000441 [Pseudohongiellaceae bacterium]|jgi:hypothetical protein
MLKNQLLSREQGACCLPTRCICLGLTVLSLTGCGFVLAPIKTVSAGTLSALVKEFDRQLSSEGTDTGSDSLKQVAPPLVPAQSGMVSPSVKLYPAPLWSKLSDGDQLKRQSIMPENHAPLAD